MMEDENEELESFAASLVGCSVELTTQKGKKEMGTITSYNPSTDQHTVKLAKGGGKEEALDLKTDAFKFVVPKPDPAVPLMKKEDRFDQALKRDAVGRKLEIYSKKYDKHYKGKIVGFDQNTQKHTMLFLKGNQTKSVNLEKYQWRYTDLVKGKTTRKGQSFKTSKYIGVFRQSEFTWSAQSHSRRNGSRHHDFFGSFDSEKEAALAYDVHARKLGKPTNFQEERWTEADVQKNRSRKGSFVQTPRGCSKYRGVCWHLNRWDASSTQGRKSCFLGSFLKERHAALAYDAQIRREGQPDSFLNFPEEKTSDAQIRIWRSGGSKQRTNMKRPSKSSPQRKGSPKRPRVATKAKACYTERSSDEEDNEYGAEGSRDGESDPGLEREVQYSSNLKYAVGTEFAKQYVEGWFKGIIVCFNGETYTVRFEDGDVEKLREEEFDQSDIKMFPSRCSSSDAAENPAGNNQ